jgi:hypothetical protein
VTEYLIELYVGAADAGAVERDAERVRAAADEETRTGKPVRYLGSIFVPEDETCYLLFEADSADTVRETAVRASLQVEHLASAVATREGP